MCERFNMNVKSSATFSPWSNGVCERYNQTLTNILLKVKGNTNCGYDTAFARAICAKNALINNNRFSLSQLDRNTNLPNFINNQLPALKTTIKLFELALHISA